MSDDYLVDKSGPKDPEVERLEGLLSEARYVPGRLKVPAVRPRRSRARRVLPWAAAASIVALAGGGVTYRAVLLTRPSFAVRQMGPGGEKLDRLQLGGWLETDARTRADVAVADIGNIHLDPDSRLQLEATGPFLHRLRLERGTLRAKVRAPPKLFVVDTPSAKATDLGCEYRLSVGPDGTTSLRVLVGEVSLEGHGRESTVFAGYDCETVAGQGPGLPLRFTAPGPLRDSVRRVDRGDSAAWEGVVAGSGPDDATTLWHLLPRVDEAARARVRARLAEVVRASECGDLRLGQMHPAAMSGCWGAIESQWSRLEEK